MTKAISRRLVSSLGFAVAFVAVSLVGRIAIVDGSQALVWPAAGVAVLWLLALDARVRSLDTGLLVAAMLGVNLANGAAPHTALVLVAANAVQVLVVVTLLRRLCPRLWGCGGDEPLGSPGDLRRFLAVAALGAALGVGLGTLGLRLDGHAPELTWMLHWWGRHFCGLVAVLTLGQLVGQWLAARRRGLPAVAVPWRVGEALVLVVATAAIYGLVFRLGYEPFAFALLAPTVWAAVRFPTLVVAAHSVGSGLVAAVLTRAGHGPLVGASAAESALAAQAFVALLIIIGLVLATARDERVGLADRLADSEREAAHQARLLGEVVASMSDGLVVLDQAGEVVLSNPAAELLAVDAGTSLAGVGAIPLMFPDGSPIPDDCRPAARVLRGEEVHRMDVRIDLTTPRVLSVSAGLLPVDGCGNPLVVVLFSDVTEERAHREELTAFAGTVAHDLLNPLTVIDGWAEALEDELGGHADPVTSQRLLRRLRGSADRMRLLISGLLEHATSIDRSLRSTRVDPSALVRDIAAVRGRSGQVVVADLPALRADEVLVRQLLDNLISNALKYVAPGVAPRVEVTGELRDGFVAIQVCDNGIGIPVEQRGLIFEQGHRAHRDDYQGTGLGLAICRRIVERHGGDVEVSDSRLGGTCFTIRLPADDAEPATEVVGAVEDQEGEAVA
ncbi:ATP-binding protein [Nocardioides pacificus]